METFAEPNLDSVVPVTIRDSRRLLLPYLLVLIALCAALQLAIAATGNEIRTLSYALLAVVEVYYAVYLLMNYRTLRQVRFGPLVAHAVTYVAVCGSFQLHAAILVFANSDTLRGNSGIPIDPGWFGPTLAMAGFWAVGLCVHAIASIAQRGFEN